VRERRLVRRKADRWRWVAYLLLAAAIAVAFYRIEDSRHQVIVRACEEQNVKHDNTIETINRASLSRLTGTVTPKTLSAEQVEQRLGALLDAMSGEEALQARSSLTTTRLIIDAALPKRDCGERLERLTG
jgi:hypothetical protein